MVPARRRPNLGYIAVPSPDPWSTAFNVGSALVSFVPKIADMFGRGRREADQLVPHQKDLYSRIQAIEAALARDDIAVEQYQSMLAALQTHWDWMQKLLSDPRWTDGRAAAQGYADMRVYVEGLTDTGQRVTRHPNRDRGGQLGVLIPPGGALGALTTRIKLMLGAFDWDRLTDLGYDIAERFIPSRGIKPYVVQGPEGPVLYDPTIGGAITVYGPDPGPRLDVPGWVTPAVIGAGVLVGGALLMTMTKRR
jgi:hypothetical protein